MWGLACKVVGLEAQGCRISSEGYPPELGNLVVLLRTPIRDARNAAILAVVEPSGRRHGKMDPGAKQYTRTLGTQLLA